MDQRLVASMSLFRMISNPGTPLYRPQTDQFADEFHDQFEGQKSNENNGCDEYEEFSSVLTRGGVWGGQEESGI